jgi:hypothetical protein
MTLFAALMLISVEHSLCSMCDPFHQSSLAIGVADFCAQRFNYDYDEDPVNPHGLIGAKYCLFE